MNSEQEMFISYLIFNIIQIHRDTGVKLPSFVKKYKEKQVLLSNKYDKDKRLDNMLRTFRIKPCPNIISHFNQFVPEFLGFYFDSSTIRSILTDVRVIVYQFTTNMQNFMAVARSTCLQMIQMSNDSYNQMQEAYTLMKQKYDYYERDKKKDSESMRTENMKYSNEITYSKQLIKAAEQDRMNIENQLNDIFPIVNSMNPQLSRDKTIELSISELKEKMKKLQRSLNNKTYVQEPSFDSYSMPTVTETSFDISELEQTKKENIKLARTTNDMQRIVMKLKQENRSLKKTTNILQEQIMAGNSDYNNLYKSLEDLHNKIQKEKERLQIEQEAKTYDYATEANAVVMKGRMLLEQTTIIKMELAEKELQLSTLKKELLAKNRQILMLQQSDQLAREKSSQMKQKYNEISTERRSMEESLINLQEINSKLSVDIKEKENIINQQTKTTYNSQEIARKATEKYTRTKEINRMLKTENREYREQISSLTEQNGELLFENQRKESTIESLSEQSSILIEEKKNADELESELHQSQLSNENLMHEIEILKEKLQQEAEINRNLQKELTDNRQFVAQSQRQIDSVKFACEKERNTIDNEKKEVLLEKERMQLKLYEAEESKIKAENSLIQAKEEAEKQNQRMEQQIIQINEANKEKVTAIERSHEIQKAEILERLEKTEADLTSANSTICDLTTELSKSQSEITVLSDQLRSLQDEISQYIPKSFDDSVADGVRKLQENLFSSETLFTAIKSEVNKTKSKHSFVFTELKSKGSNSQDNQLSFLFEFITAFDYLVQRYKSLNKQIEVNKNSQNEIISQLNDVKVKSIQEIPKAVAELSQQLKRAKIESSYFEKDLKTVKEGHQKLLNDLSKYISFNLEENLVQAAAEMKNNNEKMGIEYQMMNAKYNDLITQLHSVLVFTEPNTIAPAIKDLQKANSTKSAQIEALTSELQQVTALNQQTTNQLNRINSQVSNFGTLEKIPSILIEMKDTISLQNHQLDEINQKHNKIMEFLVSTFTKAEDEETAIEAVTSLCNEHESLTNTYLNLIELKEKFSSALRKHIKFTTDQDIIAAVQAQNHEHKELQKKFEIIVNENDERKQYVSQLEAKFKELDIKSLDEAPKLFKQCKDQLAQVSSDYEALNERNQKLIESLFEIADTRNENDLIHHLIQIKSERDHFESEFRNLTQKDQAIFDDLRQIVRYVNEEELPSVVRAIVQQLDEKNEAIQTLEANLSSIISINDIQELPSLIDSLQRSLEDKTKSLEAVSSKYSSFVELCQARLQGKISRKTKLNSQEENILNSISTLKENYEANALELKDLTNSRQILFQEVQKIVEIHHEDEIPNILQQMKDKQSIQQDQIENMTNEIKQRDLFVENLKSSFMKVIEFNKLEEIPSQITSMNEKIEEQQHHIEEVTSHFISFNQQVRKLIGMKKERISKPAIPSTEEESNLYQKITTTVNTLNQTKEELSQTKSRYEAIFFDLQKPISFTSEEEVPEIVTKLVNENQAQNEQIRTLSNDLKDKVAYISNLNNSMKKVIDFKEMNEIPGFIKVLKDNLNKTNTELNKLNEKHNQLVSQMISILGKDATSPIKEKNIPMIASDLLNSFNSLKEENDKQNQHYSSIFSSLHDLVTFRNEIDIIDVVNKMNDQVSRQSSQISNLSNSIKQLQGQLSGLRTDFSTAFIFNDLSEVPRLAKKLKSDFEETESKLSSLSERHSSMCSNIFSILDLKKRMKNFPTVEDEETAENAVETLRNDMQHTQDELASTKNHYGSIFESIHRIVEFNTDDDLPSTVNDLVQTCNKQEKMIEKLSGQLNTLETRFAALEMSFRKYFSFKTIEDVPSIAGDLKQNYESSLQEIQRLKASHEKFVNKIKSIIQFKSNQLDEDLVTSAVNDLKINRDQLEKLRNHYHSIFIELHSLAQFNSDNEITKVVKNLNETNQRQENQIKSLNFDLAKVRDTLSTCSNEKQVAQQKIASYSSIFNMMRTSIPFTSESELPELVKKMAHENATSEMNTKKDRAILESLRQIINVRKNEELAVSVTKLKGISQLHEQVMNELHDLIAFSEDKKVPLVVKELKERADMIHHQLLESSEFFRTLLMYVKGYQSVKNFSLPLNPEAARVIVQSFQEFIKKAQRSMNEVDSFLKEAHSQGYHGDSVHAASDFLSNEFFKKKSQALIEENHLQLVSVREDKEKERLLLEDRLAKETKIIKELREAKIEQSKQVSKIQSELGDQIATLEKSVTECESKIEKYERIKEELIRFCCKEIYDKSLLQSALTKTEQRKLNLR